ncbi:MAG: GUN4 domain-containing protein [Leptolyngbyaceae cyanobacterium]
MSNSGNSSQVANQLAEYASKVLQPGGVAVGGAYGLWELFVQDDAGKAIAAALIGFCISYGGHLLKDWHQGNQKRMQSAGAAIEKVFSGTIEQMLAKATKAEDAYLLLQVLDCRDYRTAGMGDRGQGILELPEVFVPLELDSSSIPAGFEQLARLPDLEQWQRELDIWYFLRQATDNRAYRQLAIIAWGGYGKTTLLKYLTYIFGTRQHEQYNVPFLIPMLLPLRQYRDALTAEPPPDLSGLVQQQRLKQLQELDVDNKLARLPATWAVDVLRNGKALVMLDGFDEVPNTERPALSQWLHRQMQRFSESTFILTSRPTAYKQDFAQPLRTKLWVRPFEPKQQTRFVEQWYFCQERQARGGRNTPEVRRAANQGAANLLAQVQDPHRPELSKLAKNPLLLNLLAIYHRNGEQGEELPRQRAELYQDICQLHLKKRPEFRKIALPLPPNARQEILQEVALAMMQRKRRLIEEEDLLALVTQALDEAKHPITAAEFLQPIVAVSELIVKQGLEGYEFAHLSFQEFLAAAQIKALKQEELLYPHLSEANQTSANGAEEPWWKQTILLYAAQLQNPTSLIEEAIRQGATNLAYACWQETQYSLPPELEAKLQTQVQTSRYAKLEALMQQGKWREADEETYRLMITTVGKEEGQRFDSEDLETFPCENLKVVDSLWVKYSDGKFGFSVQKQIWQKCNRPVSGRGKDWVPFLIKVGWSYPDGRQKEYELLAADPELSPSGEFPNFMVFSPPSRKLLLATFMTDMKGIFSRAETCGP